MNVKPDIEALGDITLKGTDLGDVSLREYLGTLLLTCWREEESFSGKRPFGNSGWKNDVYRGLVEAGKIPGALDQDGWLESCDEEAGEALVVGYIREMYHPLPNK